MARCGICNHTIEGENYVKISLTGFGELVEATADGAICEHCWEWAQSLLHEDAELTERPADRLEAGAD